MSIEERVEEWLRKMGYNADIPSDLPKICNPTTAFIWEQLISNVNPREEIQNIKRNILVNRLSQKPLEQQDQFPYPIKEIQVYMKKVKLSKQEKKLESMIKEQEVKIDEALKTNKVAYVHIDSIKERVKENLNKKFLLERKSQMIKKDIQNSQDVLALARNLTPVEMEASANGDEITKTLEQCAEKLKKLSETISLPKSNKNSRLLKTSTRTPKASKYSKNNTISQYVNMSTVLTDIAPSCKKPSYANKENINSLQVPGVCRHLKFQGEETPINTIKAKPNRESLGILPAECINISDELEMFLSETPEQEIWTLESLSESRVETKDKSFVLVEKLRGHKHVKELLTTLLHQNSRYLIVSQCRNIFEDLFREMSVSLMECNNLISTNNSIGKPDLTELFFVHVEGELEKEKCRLLKKKLHDVVKRKKEEILLQLCNRSRDREETRIRLDSQIEQAYINGANNFLRQDINSARKGEGGNDIELLNFKIRQVKEEMVEKSTNVQDLVCQIFKVFEDIRRNREETSSCVRALIPCVHNLDWAAEITKEVTSQEVQVFAEFPLEYNRKFKNKELHIFYRDICNTIVPSYIKLDPNDLAMVTSLIDSPFSSAENIIFDHMRTKIIGNKLQSMSSSLESLDVNNKKYSLDMLNKREDYIEPVIRQLYSVINSGSVCEVLSAPVEMQEITKFWQEMSFTNYVSDKRQVDGHTYEFYKQELQKLKENSI